MAELNLPMNRSASRRVGSAAVAAPRLVMSWEDWLTFTAVLVTFLSVAISIQQAHWVAHMPALVPTAVAGLFIGLFAARIRLPAVVIHPVALALGIVFVAMAAQSFADGATIADRLADFRLRMEEWYRVVRAGDISNDNLPFVTLVHGVTFLSAYLASWSIYRWHNAWLAVLPGGAVLLANISFMKGQPSGAFIVFLFGAILLVGRAYLQRSQARWRRQGVEYPDFISFTAVRWTFVLSLALVIGAWLAPVGKEAGAVAGVWGRLIQPLEGHSDSFVRLFHNVDSRRGASLHSFGPILPIQGNVKLGTKVLLEASSGQPGLIRATSYDEYTGAGWKATSRDEKRVQGQGELPEIAPDAVYKARTVSILRVNMLSDESTLLSPGTPIATNIDAIVETGNGAASDIERMRSRRGLEPGDTYNMIGSESTATADQLQAAGAGYPDWVKERYLQLPKELPKRVADEARRVAAGAKTPYDQAAAVEQYLRTLPYDLAVESAPPKRDTVDFLLFDLKRGYFDYQATAMAVMLRTLGVPARVAVGFVLDPSKAEETRYTVAKDDAYTWVEVFFPGYGWVNFNPTQDRPAGGAGGFGTGTTPAGGLTVPSLGDLLPFGDDFEKPLPDDIQKALTEQPVQHTELPWTLIYTLAGILTFAVATLLASRVAWNWGLGGLEGHTRLWAKVHRLAGWAGLRGSAAETPREWSRRLGSTIGRPDDAASLAAAYEESRYGRPGLRRVDEEVAVGSYRKLRNALAARILHYGRRAK